MGGAIGRVSFIAGASIDPDTNSGGFRVRDVLTGYSKATWKACYLFMGRRGGRRR